ncbi:MAG: WG repeat-containing protein [Clostridia bacterium]|nr:WG repeat-containing protein [Clostridia bacterium]
MVIQANAEWTMATRFSENLACVYSEDTCLSGYIDRSGNVVIPIIYQYAGDFHDGKTVVADEIGFRYILQNGEPFTNAYWEYAEDFNNGYAVVHQSGLAGYIDADGDSCVPCIYKRAEPANDDHTAWVSPDEDHFFLISLDDGSVLAGPFLLPVYDDDFAPHMGHYYVIKTENGMGVIDNEGKMVIEPAWSYIFVRDGEFVLRN